MIGSVDGAAFVIALPGTTAAYTTTVVEELIDFEATTYCILTPGLQVDVEGTTLTQWPIGAVWTKAHAHQRSILPDFFDVEIVHRRLLPGIALDMVTPASVMGRPMSPKYWGKSTVDANLTQYVGHLYAVPDTDPVWDADNSKWIYPPPDGGVGQKRWSVKSMPNPLDFPDNTYWVGQRSLTDGTWGSPPETWQWSADKSTSTAESWYSTYPYKPYMTNYRHYNPDGTTLDFDRSLHFNHAHGSHMWMATDVVHQPITWIVVAIVYPIAGFNHQHTILDAGASTAKNVKTPTYAQIQDGVHIVGREGMPNACFMGVDNNAQYGGTHFDRYQNVRVSHPGHIAPRCYFTVFNGAKTIVGYKGATDRNIKTGKTPVDGTSFSHFLMGRRNGIVDTKSTAHMIVFEVRYWSSALTLDEIGAQCHQLASTWKFSQFR